MKHLNSFSQIKLIVLFIELLFDSLILSFNLLLLSIIVLVFDETLFVKLLTVKSFETHQDNHKAVIAERVKFETFFMKNK